MTKNVRRFVDALGVSLACQVIGLFGEEQVPSLKSLAKFMAHREIVDAHNRGLTIREISAQYKITTMGVRNILKKANRKT